MARCIKLFLFALNFIIWLGGAVLLGLSVWVFTQDTQFKHVTGNIIVNASFIGLASFMFILGFIGTCGILLGSRCLLKMYFAFVLLFFFIQVGLGVFLYSQRAEIEEHVKHNWNNTSEENRIIIQEKLKCCSVNPVILSHKSSDDISCFTSTNKTERLQDCYNKLANWFEENWIILGTSAIALALFEIFILCGSCRLLFELERANRLPKPTQVVPLETVENPRNQKRLAGYPPHPDNTEDAEDGSLTGDRWDGVVRKDWAKNAPRQQLQPKQPKKKSLKK